jgi:4-carboxymuconolactone decarboxylase
MSDEVYERGLQIRREVVGDEYVDRAFAQVEGDGFGADFQRLVTEYCWGASWGREALTRRDRSLLNLAILGTLGRSTEFKTHIRGALKNGVTPAEIEDALTQLAIYAGVPAGMEAFRLAREVLEAEGALDTKPAGV